MTPLTLPPPPPSPTQDAPILSSSPASVVEGSLPLAVAGVYLGAKADKEFHYDGMAPLAGGVQCRAECAVPRVHRGAVALNEQPYDARVALRNRTRKAWSGDDDDDGDNASENGILYKKQYKQKKISFFSFFLCLLHVSVSNRWVLF